MHTRALVVLALVAGSAGAATAQERVTFSWTWGEVVVGTTNPVANPNGLIEPGEAAELRLRVSFTPAVGEPINYNPPPGPGSGVVGGFASALFGMEMTGGFNGHFTHGRRAPGLTIGSHGTLDGNFLWAIQVGQIAFPETPLVNTSNPIDDCWRIVWTPGTYDVRTVTFIPGYTIHTHAHLYLRYGGTPEAPLWTSKQVSMDYGNSLHIPVVPSPSVIATFSAALLTSARRRRPRLLSHTSLAS